MERKGRLLQVKHINLSDDQIREAFKKMFPHRATDEQSKKSSWHADSLQVGRRSASYDF